MSDGSLDPRLKQALDEGIAWIKEVLELEAEHGMAATIKAVDDLDDEQARKLLFVLTSYAADSRKMAALVENWRSAPMN